MIAGTALLVIDMQNAYCDPKGEFAAAASDPLACQRVIEPCSRAIASARDHRVPILFAVKVGLSTSVPTATFRAEPSRFPSALQKGSWSAQIVDALRPQPGDIVLEKLAFSAFFGTALDTILRKLGVRELVITGVTTSICVESTARDAVQHGFKTCIVSDATAEWDLARHERALEQMAYAFSRVAKLEDVIASWKQA